jgi:hypothetical protein
MGFTQTSQEPRTIRNPANLLSSQKGRSYVLNNAMAIVKDNGLASIAFPLIGAGPAIEARIGL